MVTSIHSMARSGGPLLANPPPDYSNETLKFSHYLLSTLSLTGGPGQVALHFVGDNDTFNFNLNLNLSLGKRNVHKYLLNIFKLSTEERRQESGGILANKTFTVAFRAEGKKTKWVEYTTNI